MIATEYNDPLLRPTRAYGVNFTAPVTETIYGDTPGNLFVKVRKQIDETNWDEATTFIDGLGRSFKTQAKDSQGDVFVETKYDNLGRVAATSNPYRTGDTVYWSKPRYDELNRVVETYAPEAGNPLDPNIHGASLGVTSFGISTAPNYVGTVVTTTDASLRKGRSITNALGQLIRVDEPTGISASADADLGTLATPNQPTFYTYSPQGKMVKVQQGVQNRYFLYDSLGRLIRVRQPEQEINASLNLSDPVTGNSQWTAAFSYDVLGNVVRATDAKGVNIVNEYDRASRVTKRCYTKPNISATATTCASIPANDQSTDTPSVSFYYDGKGLAAPQSPNYAKGKLTKVDNGISATEYMTFDNLGRLTRSRQVTDGVVYGDDEHPITYSYNLSGGLVQETYPSGRVVKNEFEPDGDLARIFGKANATATERTYANAFAYTPDGKIESLRLGNLLWEKAKFNTRLQTTEIALGHGVSSGDLWKLNYEFGELNTDGSVDTTKNTGNIARQTVSFNGLPQPFVQSYKYDSLYRLTEARETSGTAANASQTWRETFGYDRFGNRTGHTKFYGTTQAAQNNVTDPIIDPNTNRFQSGQGYLFDKNGNLTTDAENRTTTFNGDNKQTKVIQNGQLVGEYFYDGEGKRVKKKVYDPNNPSVVTEETIFVYSSNKLVAEYSTKPPPPDPTTSYTATDMLGSPRVITNALGEVTSRRDFMPFGEQVYSEPSFRPTSLKYNTGDDVRQKFTGYQKDEETQLDFAEARMYQNKHGRFTAIDPLLASGKSPSPQTFNRYVYVMNNPLAFTDPSGLQAATTPLQNVYPCERNDCAYTINGTGRNPILTVNTRPLDTTTITAEPDLIAMSAPVTLGTVITTRLPLLAGGASTATTAGAASVAAPAAAAGCAALLCALLASRIGDYTPGGIYDATVNRPTWRDGYPVISTIGGSNTQIGNPALAIPIPTTTTDRIPAPPPPDTFPGLFRGGPSLAPRPGEFRVRNGLVQSTHGPSTNIDPFKVMRFGGAYRVGPLPLGLTAVQRGVDQGHYEIVPSSPIAVEEYIRLLSMVPLTPYRP